MNTVDQLLCTLKQNSALLQPVAKFLDAVVQVQSHAQPQKQGFAQTEKRLLEHVRIFSSEVQAHVLSAWDQQAPKTLIHQGKHFTRSRRVSKSYQGLDGLIRVRRWLYSCAESAQTICPLEMRAGLVEGQLTPAAARFELMSAASDDYRKAVQLQSAGYILGRSKSSLQRDILGMSQRIQRDQDALEQTRRAQLEPVDGVVSISVSVDRTGLPFEEPIKRKPGRPKKGAPKTPCEVIKRQVYCACISLHDHSGAILSTQRFAGLPTQGDEVVAWARACLKRQLAWTPEASLVQLCDGAHEMQRRAEEILQGHKVDARLVDAWHAASYVRQAFAAAGHPETYGQEMVRRLLKNKTGVSENLTRLRTLAANRDLKEVDDAIRYLSNNKHLMDYARARERGLAIGSGSVEATCKSVVAVRFKRSGARWKPPGASPLLSVRSWMNSDQDVWWPVCDAFLRSYVTTFAA